MMRGNGFLKRLKRAALELRGLNPADDRYYDTGTYYQAKAGVNVTEENALQIASVHNCVSVLAETVASLSLPVYRRLKPRGKERAPDHPVYKLLHDRPNPEITSMAWRETQMGWLLLWGNCYSWIERDRKGKPVALWPWPANRVSVFRGDKFNPNSGDRSIYYYLQLDDGTVRKFPAEQVLHIPGFGFDGLKGMSRIGCARNALGLAVAAEEFGSAFYKNGVSFSGVLQHPAELGDKAFARLEQWMNKRHAGLSNAMKLGILEEGMTYNQTGMPLKDAQFLELRKYQDEDIARFFNMPPHMIKQLGRATWANIEQQALEFVIYTLRPYLVRWEQHMKMRLFDGDDNHFAEFLVDSLLRGDRMTRAQALQIELMNGAISPNEWREIENRNPRKGGDTFYTPANLIPEGAPAATFSSKEKRSEVRAKGAAARVRLRGTYGRLIKQVAEGIVTREVRRIKDNIGKLGTRGKKEFQKWLNEFYEGNQRDYIVSNYSPVAASYSEEVTRLASKEVTVDDDIKKEVDKFTKEYVGTYAKRHISSSLGQLNKILDSDDIEDKSEAIIARMDEWDETRADKIARDERVRLGDAVASVVFFSAGAALMWYATGSDPCPFCQDLDGKVVGRNEPFVSDEDITTSGGTMHVYGAKIHPPLHDGCECTIVPE